MKKISMVFMVLALLVAAAPKSNAQIGIGAGVSITVAPPLLPVYEQPFCPGDGYIWTPGYWAYGDDGYYWVDGQWVLAPQVGFLWTPPYWGFDGGLYVFHSGYWGPHIGFYGGINYGFGYTGHGYWGGRWSGGHFMYNTAFSRVNVTIVHNTYVNRSVAVNNYSHASFNGRGGITERARPEELQAMHERHIATTTAQVSHQTAARGNRSNLASVNHGRPAGVGRADASAARVGTAQNAKGDHNAGVRQATRPTGATASHAGRAAHNNAAPAQHYAAQQHHTPPAQHYASAQRRAAPRQHAAPAQHVASAEHYAVAQHNSRRQPAVHSSPAQRPTK